MNTKTSWQVTLFQGFSLLLLGGMAASYLIHLGQPNPLEAITNLLTSGYALLATWLAIGVWALLGKDKSGQRQWAFLSIGIGLWTMAELLWTFLSYILAETPYPSIADAFWIPGYIMVLISATMRYRAFKIQWNSRLPRILLGTLLVIVVVVFAWVILPILASGEAGDLLVLILNVFYPVADLLVLFAALLLALLFAGGQFAIPWAVLAVGLATLSFSDILFTYADWNGFYAADSRLTWLTFIVDMGNLTAYVLIAYGILLNYRLLSDSAQPKQKSLPLQARAAADLQKVMIFIDDTDRVVFANYNLSRLRFAGTSDVMGMPIGQVLEMAQHDIQTILADLHTSRIGNIEKYITKYHADGAEISGWLRGRANFNDLREYTGADIACDVEYQPDAVVKKETAGRFISASHTLVFDSREHKLLLDYFSRVASALHKAVIKMGGGTVSGVFDDVFRAAVSREACVLCLEEGKIRVDQLPAQPQSYARILSALAEYARGMFSVELVSGIWQRVDDTADSEMLAAARKFGLTS